MVIETPNQLPLKWRARFIELAETYATSRMYESDEAAARDAFLQVRDGCWRGYEVHELDGYEALAIRINGQH